MSTVRRLCANVAYYTSRSFCSVGMGLEGHGPNESLHVASVAVAAYTQQMLESRGITVTPSEAQKIERDVRGRLQMLLGPELGSKGKGPRSGDPSFVPLNKPHHRIQASIFFADMKPEEIWKILSRYIAGEMYIAAEDVVAALRHASREPPPSANQVSRVLWTMRPQLLHLQPRHVGTLFSVLHTFGVKDRILIKHVFKRFKELQSQFEFREAAEILICSVNLPFNHVPLTQLHDTLKLAISRMTRTMPQSICRLLHALALSPWRSFALGRHENLKLVAPVLALLKDSITSFNAIDVAQSLEAMHFLGQTELKAHGVDCQRLIRELIEQGQQTIESANVLDVSELMRAASSLHDLPLLDWFYAQASKKLSESDQPRAKALNDMLATISQSNLSEPGSLLCSQILRLAKESLSEFRPAQLCHFLNSCSLLEIKDTELLLGLCDHIRRSVKGLNAETIVLALKACTKLGLEQNHVTEALLTQAARLPKDEKSVGKSGKGLQVSRKV